MTRISEPRLRQLLAIRRVEKGLSIAELATLSNCSPVEIVGFERGLFVLAAEKVCFVVKALNISENELAEAAGPELAEKIRACC